MKAIILAAGKGTRMRELTQAMPKPMIPVGGRPILEHIVSGLIRAGIRQICLVTGWRSEVIKGHFQGGERWGVSIEYVDQETQDGTGKAPELAKGFVGEDSFLLTYGDILVPPETYERMVRAFREDGGAGLVTVTSGEDVKKGGIVVFDDQFRVKRLVEKPTQEEIDQLRAAGQLDSGKMWYNAGIYVFRPVLFEFTARLEKSPRGEYELTSAVDAMARAGERLKGMEIQGRWVDVRDPETLALLGQNEGQ